MALESARSIRKALKEFELSAASHQAAVPPPPSAIFSPDQHASAIDPDRALVVGSRGVGKSFWSSVLADSNSRRIVAKDYPDLDLENTKVVLGFHEGAGKDEGVAPSPSVLRNVLKNGHDPYSIWLVVLLDALRNVSKLSMPKTLLHRVQWLDENTEVVEEFLRAIDKSLRTKNQKFVLLFDALDRLGAAWNDIRPLSKGILQLALDLRGYRAIRAKAFMRPDQYGDTELFGFSDASKLRAESVTLKWARVDLYGLLFYRLWHDQQSKEAIRALAKRRSKELPYELKAEEESQMQLFKEVAGEYMGADRRRGRTYSWLHDHLADAFGETSPRSFLVAVRTAAQRAGGQTITAIDHHGIRAGVQEASTTRLDQLKEDYPWIELVLSALEGLEVPSDPAIFKQRWREKKVVRSIGALRLMDRPSTPIELDLGTKDPEESLISALEHIGVLERRESTGKVNLPDIFRVAANMKRRGGVRPPTRS